MKSIFLPILSLLSILFVVNAQGQIQTFNAGTLKASPTSTSIMQKGPLDARDFVTLRDKWPKLIEIDLPGAIIEAYKGKGGTISLTDSFSYNAREIPINALKGNMVIQDFAYPTSVSAIRKGAFEGTKASIRIRENTIIEAGAFYNYKGVITVEKENVLYAAIAGALVSKDSTVLIQRPTSTKPAYTIPAKVKTIGSKAFHSCTELSSITIPTNVTKIDSVAFVNCSGIISFSIMTADAKNIELGKNAFGNIDKTKCTLYVKIGSKASFHAAEQWKDFAAIVEQTNVSIETQNIENLNIFPNPVVESFQIEGIIGIANVSVINANGQLLKQQKVVANQAIEIQSLQNGVYFAIITTANGIVTKKIVKNAN